MEAGEAFLQLMEKRAKFCLGTGYHQQREKEKDLIFRRGSSYRSVQREMKSRTGDSFFVFSVDLVVALPLGPWGVSGDSVGLLCEFGG